MKKVDFIKRAKIIEIGEISRSTKLAMRTTLRSVESGDKCYLIKSGNRLQFWITRNEQLMSVNYSKDSPFCVCIDNVG